MMVHQYIDIPQCPDQNLMPKVQTVGLSFICYFSNFFHLFYIPTGFPLCSLPEPSSPSTLPPSPRAGVGEIEEWKLGNTGWPGWVQGVDWQQHGGGSNKSDALMWEHFGVREKPGARETTSIPPGWPQPRLLAMIKKVTELAVYSKQIGDFP